MHFSAVPDNALLHIEQVSRLAPEIHDLILGNIRDSKIHLSNCSLVCRSWMRICRSHLFNEVEFRSDFARFLSSSPHAKLTITPYIRKVVVKSDVINHEEKEILVQAVLQLPELRSLHVERFSLDGIRSPSNFILGTQSPSQLSILELESVSFTTFHMLTDFLYAFSDLQILVLENVSWRTLGCSAIGDECVEGSTTPKTFSLNLKKLHLASCHNVAFLNWLLYGVISDVPIGGDSNSCRQFPHLVALSLPDSVLAAEVKLLNVFLASLGETLEQLDIGKLVQNDESRGSDDASHYIDLSANSNIRSVTIHRMILFRFPSPAAQVSESLATSPSSPYAWIPALISTIQSTDIRTIKIMMWFSNESQLDTIQWSALSSAVLKTKVPVLKFHISGIGRDIDLVEKWIMRRLEGVDQNTTAVQFDFLG